MTAFQNFIRQVFVVGKCADFRVVGNIVITEQQHIITPHVLITVPDSVRGDRVFELKPVAVEKNDAPFGEKNAQ